MAAPLWTVAALCLAHAPIRPADRPTADVVVEVVLRKDCVVQVVKGDSKDLPKPAKLPALWGETRTVSRGLAVLHTVPAERKKTVLFAGGYEITPGPPMGIDRVYHRLARVAGVAAEGDRLYVLVAEAQVAVIRGGRDADYKEMDLAAGKPTSVRLLVFRPSDGKVLHELRLKPGDLPGKMPEETAKPGPLKLIAGGVSCYGVVFEFKDGKVIEQRVSPDKPRP